MKWKYPPVIKIYEALGTIPDGRIEVVGNTARVYSSSRNKFYEVTYDPATNAIMANDNGSYWQGYLGYPAIAYLLQIGVLNYKPEFGEMMKGIMWKDLNQKLKSFTKVLEHIFSTMEEPKKTTLQNYVADVAQEIKELNLNILGEKIAPPEGY